MFVTRMPRALISGHHRPFRIRSRLSGNDLQRASNHQGHFCDECREIDSAKLFSNTRTLINLKSYHPSINPFVDKHEGYAYQKTFGQIRMSAAEGCPLCRLLAQVALRTHSVRHPRQAENLPIPRDNTRLHLRPRLRKERKATKTGLSVYSGVYSMCLDAWRPDLPHSSDQLDQSEFGELAVYADANSQAAISGDVVGRLISDPEDISITRNWFNECLTEHQDCLWHRKNPDGISSLEDISPSPLPTRVIDVGAPDGSQEPFLLDSRGRSGHYIALSHSWGRSQIVTTTNSTIRKHEACIHFESLPKTFKDAIITTRQLGLRYLWIDSLCIIQDSIRDWDHEASRMHEVYKNALLTVAASEATSAETGLFLTREQTYLENSVKIPYRKPDSRVDGFFYLADGSFIEHSYTEVNKGPLNQRAWTLQERMLSPRIVHYAKSQLYWECETVSKAENGWDLEDWSPAFSWPPITSLEYVLDMNDEVTMFQKWHKVVNEYSRRSMTYSKDKLPALAALARTFAESSEFHYIAGLWEENLTWDLLWRAAGEDDEAPMEENPVRSHWGPPKARGSGWVPGKLREPLGWRAPSWSWASLDGPVKFPVRETWSRSRESQMPISPGGFSEERKFAFSHQIPDVSIEVKFPSPDADPFSAMVGASLTVTANMQGIKADGQARQLRTIEGNVIDGRMYLDYVSNLADLDGTQHFYALAVSCHPSMISYEHGKRLEFVLHALVLQPVAENTFRRVGVIDFEGDGELFPYATRRSILII